MEEKINKENMVPTVINKYHKKRKFNEMIKSSSSSNNLINREGKKFKTNNNSLPERGRVINKSDLVKNDSNEDKFNSPNIKTNNIVNKVEPRNRDEQKLIKSKITDPSCKRNFSYSVNHKLNKRNIYSHSTNRKFLSTSRGRMKENNKSVSSEFTIEEERKILSNKRKKKYLYKYYFK